MKFKNPVALAYGVVGIGIGLLVSTHQAVFHHRMNVLESNQLIIIEQLNRIEQNTLAVEKAKNTVTKEEAEKQDLSLFKELSGDLGGNLTKSSPENVVLYEGKTGEEILPDDITVYEDKDFFYIKTKELIIAPKISSMLQNDGYSYYKVLKGLIKLSDGTYIAPKEYLKMVQ